MWGFVRQPPPQEGASTARADAGPIYYGPDARVLFSDWFLASHCFRIHEAKTGDLLEVFDSRPSGEATGLRSMAGWCSIAGRWNCGGWSSSTSACLAGCPKARRADS